MTFIQSIKKYIETQQLTSKGTKILIGVSGGPDSMALLHVLLKLRHELASELHVAHFNHQLRNDSTADQKFVEDYASKYNLPIYTDEWKNARTKIKGSLEELARKKRMDFFNQCIKKHKLNRVALAHTEDDVAETILMRLIRGSGLQGLRGILPKRELNGTLYIRPFLGVPKKAVLKYCKANKIPFRIDSSNQQKIFFRNQVRLDLIPKIEKSYKKNIKHILAKTSHHLSVDYDFISQAASKKFNQQAKKFSNTKIRFTLKPFMKNHQALQKWMLRKACEELVGSTNKLTSAHLEDIEQLIRHKPKGSIVHLPKKLSVHKGLNFIEVILKARQRADNLKLTQLTANRYSLHIINNFPSLHRA